MTREVRKLNVLSHPNDYQRYPYISYYLLINLIASPIPEKLGARDQQITEVMCFFCSVETIIVLGPEAELSTSLALEKMRFLLK